MPRSAARFSSARSSQDRSGLYQEITDTIVAQLEAGRVPWVQPWSASSGGAQLGLPRNAATGRAYTGINVLILWNAVCQRGFSGQRWLTFKQALAVGGCVRKGERGTTVVFADRFTPEGERERAERDGYAPGAIPFLKRFTVFNVDQCDGLPDGEEGAPALRVEGAILPEVEALIAASKADFRIGGSQAFYSPAHDFIQVPPPEVYFEAINWHRTALHEMSHWSGHPARLNRNMSGEFGSSGYGREELCAEISCAYVCAALGIVPTVRHADYIGAWLDIIREDNRAIVRAASAASKAADFLLAFRPGAIEAKGNDAVDLETQAA